MQVENSLSVKILTSGYKVYLPYLYPANTGMPLCIEGYQMLIYPGVYQHAGVKMR